MAVATTVSSVTSTPEISPEVLHPIWRASG